MLLIFSSKLRTLSSSLRLFPLFNGQLAFSADEPRKGMGIGNLLLPESPINDISHQQLLLKGMPRAESHPADDTNGYGIFVHSLLCTNITLHRTILLFVVNKLILNVYHGKGQKSKNGNKISGRDAARRGSHSYKIVSISQA